MKLVIDTDTNILRVDDQGVVNEMNLYSKEAFEEISRQWVRVGWNQKYQYTFSWFGRPIIQLPEDMVRMQEVIFDLQPDVIIETGVAHGGSLVYYASICKAIGKGRVIGVDVEIRTHNREAIESHLLADFIALIEGSSTDIETISKVKSRIQPDEKVLVILDSNHSRPHVLAELRAYAPLVTPGSYIVATDGIMYDLQDVPRGEAKWLIDNPMEAAKEFVIEQPDFSIEQPDWGFNESDLDKNITHWPGAWLKRS